MLDEIDAQGAEICDDVFEGLVEAGVVERAGEFEFDTGVIGGVFGVQAPFDPEAFLLFG